MKTRLLGLGLGVFLLACSSKTPPPVEPAVVTVPSASPASTVSVVATPSSLPSSPSARSDAPAVMDRHVMPPASPPERATAAIARLGTTCDDPKTSAPYVLITCSKRGTVAGVSFTQTMPAASALPKSGTRFGAKTDHAPTMNSFVAVVDSGRVWLEEPCMICRINSTGYRIITLADASDEDLVAMAVEVGLPKKALHTEAEWLKALATVGTKE